MSTFRRDILSTVGSDITSEVYMTADAEELTIQLIVPSATTVILSGSNDTGKRAGGIVVWSVLTTIESVATNTVYNIEPGFRWFRCQRETASVASLSQAILAGRNDDGW